MKKFLLTFLLILPLLSLKAEFLEGPAASRVVYGAEAVRISERTGHVQYIRFGENAPKSLDQLLEKRQPWMPAYQGQVSFREKSQFKDAMGITHRHMQMLVDGLPIEGGIIITHERNGQLEALNGDLFRIKCATQPGIGEAQALQSALNHVGAERYIWERNGMAHRFDEANLNSLPQGELVYAPKKGEYRDDNFVLAWRFDIYAASPLSRRWIFVDAQTGQVVHTLNRIHTADVVGTAITHYSGSRVMTADQTGPNAYRLRETGRGGGVATFNCQTGTSYAAAVDFTDTDNVWNNINTAQDEYATDAHVGAEKTYDYYSTVHGWNSYNNANAPLNSYVHFDVAFGNAFWDGTQMTYGDGDGFVFSGPLTTFDVCGHEITHGVTEYAAGLIYADESGALNESFSDIFGNVLEHREKPGSASWLVGEECTPGNTGIRSMADPTIFQNPGCYNGQYWFPGADVHTNSGVQNHWFYILTMGDAGTNDLGNVYNVAGLGWTKAEAIAFRNLSVYLTPSSDYADARFYAIQSASDLYGACNNEMIQTANAWYAVGVGGPWSNTPLAAFTATPRNFCDAPATVNFLNNSNSGASFMWYFGDGTTSTQANPSHTYTNLGTYNVKLVVTGCTGARDSILQSNYVVVDTNIACTVTMPPVGSTTLNYCTGSLQDPGGYGDYPDNANSTVIITPVGADYIVLSFNSFDLEDFYDYLTIYDGPSAASPMIGSYTGQTLPNGGTITSSNGSITLVFTSDGSVTRAGFDVGFECFSATAAPVAVFSAQPFQTCDGVVNFTDLSTNHPNNWEWRFGDGTTDATNSPTHQYTTPGTYSVTLITCNAIGCDTSVCTNCVVYNPNASACQITTLPTTGTTNLPNCGGTVMDDGGTGDYADNVDVVAIIAPPGASQVQLTFSQFDLEQGWDFLEIFDGNSTAAPSLGVFTGNTLPNNGLPFASSGGALTLHFTTDVSVTMAGFVATWSSTGATASAVANFSAPATANAGQVVNFTDASTNATAWNWTFGDGGTSTLQNPTHTYAAPGVYTVYLSVSNSTGCDTPFEQTITIGGVSVNPANAIVFELWPNPSNGRLQLKMRGEAANNYQLNVVNAVGQVVFAEKLGTQTSFDKTVDLSQLSKGLYFVQLRSADGLIVRKLILE